jgi:hypothetical protein
VAVTQFEMPTAVGAVDGALATARALLGDLALKVFWEAPAGRAPPRRSRLSREVARALSYGPGA